MTLQQAHELQRRELISLRAKVTRLEKQTTGLFPVEEKETLERRIRHLEQVNKTENRRHEEDRAHWKLMESLKFDLELENHRAENLAPKRVTSLILHLSFLPLRNLLLSLLQMHLFLIQIYILQEKRLPNNLSISPYL